MKNDNLPPLPERDTFTFLTANTPVYTADQMREYARAAIEMHGPRTSAKPAHRGVDAGDMGGPSDMGIPASDPIWSKV